MRGSFLSDRSAGRGYCSFAEPSPQPSLHTQAGTKSESPLTWINCLPHPSGSMRPHLNQITGPLKPFLVAIPYKWPISVQAANVPKISQRFTNLKQTAPGFGTPCTACQVAASPALAATPADHFVPHTRWSWARHRQRLTLACTSRVASEPVYQVDSFRPPWSTTQPPL